MTGRSSIWKIERALHHRRFSPSPCVSLIFRWQLKQRLAYTRCSATFSPWDPPDPHFRVCGTQGTSHTTRSETRWPGPASNWTGTQQVPSWGRGHGLVYRVSISVSGCTSLHRVSSSTCCVYKATRGRGFRPRWKHQASSTAFRSSEEGGVSGPQDTSTLKEEGQAFVSRTHWHQQPMRIST